MCRSTGEAKNLPGSAWTEEEREAKRQMAERLNLRKHLKTGYHGPLWTSAQLKLLGKFPDDEVARRTGRTVNAVRIERERQGIPNPESRGWTAEEIAQLGTGTDAEVAARIGRTPSAVVQKRTALGISRWRVRRRAGR